MAKYIILISWTGEGIKGVKDSPKRLDMAKKAFQAAGANLEQFFLVMGRYDMIAVAEAPDDETVAKLALTVGSGGAIRTETLRAFTEQEYLNIIASLG